MNIFAKEQEKPAMFIAVNKIQAPAAHMQAMLDGFKKAAPEMKRFKGFLGLELWTTEDNTVLAVSRWASKEALDEYLNDDLFKGHHGGSRGEQARVPSQVTYYSAEVLD